MQELETEVESLRQLFVTTKDKLSGREQEVERLQDDLSRKTQVLSLLALLVPTYKY